MALAAPSACESVNAVSLDKDSGPPGVPDAASDCSVPDAVSDVSLEAADAAADATSDDATANDAADASLDASPSADADLDAGSDAAADASSDAEEAGDATPDVMTTDGACSGSAGPAPVRVGAYCVDSTEVTNDDYAAFLAVDAGSLAPQPAACTWNTSYVPNPNGWPPGPDAGAYPVVAVDWCDAYAYCAWAGKRLCGAPGGGSASYADLADAGASQWFAACSMGGALVYPYGDTYDNAACNGADFPDADILRPTGSLPACVGGYAGLFDMSGNVFEWEDACEGDGGAGDLCRIRGGSYFSFEANLACAADVSFARSASVYGDIGFRCCSP